MGVLVCLSVLDSYKKLSDPNLALESCVGRRFHMNMSADTFIITMNPKETEKGTLAPNI